MFLEDLNGLVKNKGLCEFWLKKSVISKIPDEEKYNFAKSHHHFKYVYCYRVVGLESQCIDCV